MAQDERNDIKLDRDENPREGGPRLPDRRPKFSLWIYLAIFLALLIQIFLFWKGVDDNTIDYSTFLDYVEEGYIQKVEIANDRRVVGEYTADAVKENRVQLAEPQQDLLGNTADINRFTTTKTINHDLVQFLIDYNARAAENEELAPVNYDVAYDDNWLGGALTWLLPLAIIIALWVFLIRRMNPGSQVLNIGKNKAVLFDAMGEQRLTFKDVAGLEEAKEEVVEVVEFLKNPKKFTRLGGKLPKGVLLVGPPGTGKTLLAKAVAGEAGTPFFSLSGSDFVEMFVGVGAARVRDLFKQAKEKAPCIIFIDEIDAIGRSRGRGMMMGANDERENTLNQLLVEMDGFNTDKGVIIMAATNRPDVLDNALLRPGRFDRQILIDRPDRIERAQIFKVHTRNLILSDNVNMEVLASQTPGFAGAEIANVCNEAALLAARLGKESIEMDDFEQAIDRVIAGLEKKNKLIAPKEKKIVAYHEAGHAIVGWFLEHTDPVIKVSIVPRGLAALGYAQSLPDERYITTKDAFMERMTMMMGGRAAEEIIFGHLSTGAQNDLERITKTAYAMVVDFGMSERVGHISFNLSSRNNEGPMFDKPYSDHTAQMIDEEVKVIIDEVRQRARAMLEEKREKLEEMAQELLKKEVLGPKELVEILGPRPHGEYVSYNGAPVNEESEKAEPEEAAGISSATPIVEAEEAGGDGMTDDPTRARRD
ncbi:MAG TPA: ATP-dependent zinc metalloprotease FtsH [Rhodothermales bacterium]|nr:ATP-dependent zinc metalloprotease FtsH [Rhodothermales bacterium]